MTSATAWTIVWKDVSNVIPSIYLALKEEDGSTHVLPGFRPRLCFSNMHSLPCREHLLHGTFPSVGAEHRICKEMR